MGHIANADGSLTFTPTPTQTVADLQALADRIERVGGILRVTSTEREQLTQQQTHVGMLIAETDTGRLYQVGPEYPQGFLIFQDWTAYTPSSSGASGGTIEGGYQVIGGTVYCRIRHTLGGAGVTAQPTYGLPVPAGSAGIEWFPGTGMLRDNSAATEVQAIIRKMSQSTVAPYCLSASGAFTQFANVGPAAPFAWGTGDVIDLQFSYRRAD
jgi:hypothetical protein